MLDHVLAKEGFRQRLLSLVVATTGTATLSATSTGFARTTGSFLTDGFAAGMEVVPAGFSAPNNAPAIIDTVSGLAMTIAGGRAVQAAAGSRSLTVGLPQIKQWQGTQNPTTTAPATVPFIVEQWVPGATFDDGAIIDTGFYVVTWNALPNRGIVATFRQMQAIRDLYPPGFAIYVGADKVRVTGSPAPQFTAPVRIATGYEMSTVRIPWRAVTTNLTAPAPTVYARWNPADKVAGITLSNGNLTDTASGAGVVRATIGKSSGKWYWEITANNAANDSLYGIANASASLTSFLGSDANGWSYYRASGNYVNNSMFTNVAAAWTTGDLIMVALDMDNGKVFFGKNGVWQGSSDPATGVNAAFTGLTGTLYPANGYNVTPGQGTTNFGASPFAYTAPSGFVGMRP